VYDTIRLWTGQYRVVRAGSPAAGERIILFDPALTESLVRDAMTDMFSAAVLYEIAARHLFVDRFTYGETEVVRRLVMALCDGRIEIYPVLEAKPEAAPVSAPPKTQPRVLVHTDVKPTSWVRLRVVDAATDAPISGARLRVTLPEGNADRAAALSGIVCDTVLLPKGASQSQSLAAGVTGLSRPVLVVLADMPEITAHDMHLMIALSRQAPGAILRAAAQDGTPGNPVLFPADLLAELRGITGDKGARALLKQHRARLHLVPLPGQRALVDLDTPEDWDAWRAGR